MSNDQLAAAGAILMMAMRAAMLACMFSGAQSLLRIADALTEGTVI